MKTLFNLKWKKNLFCGLFLSLATIAPQTQAQTMGKTYREPSPGIYTMTQLCGEDGKYIPSPFEQYKFVDKGQNLYDLAFLGSKLKKGENGQIAFLLHREEYTTLVSGSTSPVQIFNTQKKGFKLKWFQNLGHYKVFPKGTFVTEQWSTKLRTDKARLLKETMAVKKSNKNPLLGVWRCIGTSECMHDSIRPADGCIVPTYKEPKFYPIKIYGKKASILVSHMGLIHKKGNNADEDANSVHIVAGTLRYTEYYDKNTTKENGNVCHIEWIEKDRFQLTFKDIQSGKVYHEIWERFTTPVYMGFLEKQK